MSIHEQNSVHLLMHMHKCSCVHQCRVSIIGLVKKVGISRILVKQQEKVILLGVFSLLSNTRAALQPFLSSLFIEIPNSYKNYYRNYVCKRRFLILVVSMYQIIFSIPEYLFLNLDKLLLTAVSFLKSEENVFPANFLTP